MPRIVTLLLLGACATAPGALPRSEPWSWRVAIDEPLTRIDVSMCTTEALPPRLTVDRRALAPLTVHTPGWQIRDGHVETDQPSACLDYSVAVSRLSHANRVGRDLVTRPGQWLLRPTPWPTGVVATLSFDLPTGTRVSTPYPLDRRLLRVDDTLARRLAHVAFGRLETSRFEVAGADFEVVTLDAPRRASREGIDTWIRTAANAVTELYDNFPTERVQVLVQPVPSSEGPVVFGLTTRGGGAGLSLLLASSAEDTELPGEWIAVHEMLHLGLPWTRDSEAWFQEGFVTYYQEVVRTRAGFFEPRAGWQRLHDGFERGRHSGTERALREESAAMSRTGAYRRVYWAGAALALTLDVDLRRATGGHRSLDHLMRLWHRRLSGDGVHHGGLELMGIADSWLGAPATCEATCREALDRTGMPDLAPLYRRLGLRIEGGRVELTDGPDAVHRDAIMAPHSAFH